MASDPLILKPGTASLWADFQARRRLTAPHAPLLTRWRRSRDLGACASGPRPDDAIVRGGALVGRIERIEPLLACGRAVLDGVTCLAAEHDYQLLLSDVDGVLVYSAGGGAFGDAAQRVRLMEGADWSEAMRGTNAIGTAVAESRPVFVHGDAHYARDYHGLVCYAAPIYDPAGRLLAVLDATSRVEGADASVGFGVLAAAQALQELMRTRAYSRAGAAVTRALARSLERMDCPVALIEAPGRISRLNAPARQLLSGAAAGEDLLGLFGASFGELAALAVDGRTRELDSGARLRLEPIDSDGHLIALLAFIEPVKRPRTRPAAPADPFHDLFAEDEATRTSLRWAARIAPSDIPIMLLAETGSGKELVARGIHRASRCAEGPFVAVNCGSIAPTLLESELFGYGAGAFTGAEKRGRHGYLRAASGGTLFLDEVAEMPLAMQAALLRVLESGVYQRVGETEPQQADVRVVCATCRNLEAMVQRGEFRKDLFFRLKGATVTLPPLRERTDVVALARRLVEELAERAGTRPPRLSDEVAAFFANHDWPGNVRELKSTLDVALVLARGCSAIELEHLPPDLVARAAEVEPERPLADAEGQLLRRVLLEEANNISRVAKRLAVARSTVYRMMRRHRLK